MKKKITLRLPAIIFAIIIFILSQIPNEMLPPNVFDWQDKALHFFVYFLFGITLIIATSTIENKKRAVGIIFLIGILYALLDEIHQIFVPGRVCDITDWISDSLGVAVSLLLINKVRRIINKTLNKENEQLLPTRKD